MPKKINDLTKMKFGQLTVIRQIEKRKYGHQVIWLCRCSCGNETEVSSTNLLSGNTKSCGCNKRKDLKGMHFGQLTAIRPTEKRKNGCIIWLCKCSCGNVVEVSSNILLSRKIKSCGCARIKNLTGMQFGRLTALCPTEKRKNGCIVWLCKCSCGNEFEVSSNSLVTGSIKSCGCARIKDLAGIQFGQLTAICPTEKRRNGHVVWLCKNPDGFETEVSSHYLISETKKHAGA